MAETLKCWDQKVQKSMKQLKEIGLVRTVQRGLTKPNLIYVMNFATEYKYKVKNDEKEAETPENPHNPLNSENHDPRNSENHDPGNSENHDPDKVIITNQKSSKSLTSKNNINQIDSNKKNVNQLEVVISMSESKSDAPTQILAEEPLTIDNDNDDDIISNKEQNIPQNTNEPVSHVKQINNPKPKDTTADSAPAYDYARCKNIIHNNIEYSHFFRHSGHGEIQLVDELVECMLDVITTQSKKVKINGELKDRQIVINKYLTLHSSDIRHILMKYKEQSNKITHIGPYLKTLLYTVKQENNFFYENDVRANDFISRLL